MRVAFLLDNLTVGGTELNAVRTAERLDRERIELSVLSLAGDGPLRARYEAAGYRVEPFEVPNLYGPAAQRQGWRLARRLRAGRIEVLHAHDRYTNVFGGVWGKVAGVPVRIASRRWWEAMPRRVYRAANRWAYRDATRVLANSPAVGRLLTDADGVPASKVVVVSNFVDEAAFTPFAPEERAARRAAFGIPADAPLLAIVANLRPVKDHGTALRALAALASPAGRAAHLLVVGDGGERPRLAALAAELGVGERAHFAGHQPGLPNLHHLADISLLTSLHEGFPNSLVEAMAAGRPVVATRVGGVVDAVTEGETGLLVPPSDPGALAAAVDALLADPARRLSMGDAARDRAARDFGAERVIGQLQHLYRDLVADPRDG